MVKYVSPSCANHNWKLVATIEPDFNKKIDGQKVYMCLNCMKTKITLIPWQQIELGGFY